MTVIAMTIAATAVGESRPVTNSRGFLRPVARSDFPLAR
jgi:hypothetical protein